MREIIHRVETALEKADYRFFEFGGCFDIAASKSRSIMLLKILSNIDSVREEQANSLKIMASSIEASAFLVGDKTRREDLDENVIYERFGVPAMTIETLENVLFNDMPVVSRARGGLFAEIDAAALRRRRQEIGLSQKGLADAIGTTKKSIYEHEKSNKKASQEIVEKLEKKLGKVSVSASLCAKNYEPEKPDGYFESIVSSRLKSIGFETTFVRQAPCNLIAQNQITILFEAEENKKRLEEAIEGMIKFSQFSKRPVLAVTLEDMELQIPSIRERDLKNYTVNEIQKIVKKNT